MESPLICIKILCTSKKSTEITLMKAYLFHVLPMTLLKDLELFPASFEELPSRFSRKSDVQRLTIFRRIETSQHVLYLMKSKWALWNRTVLIKQQQRKQDKKCLTFKNEVRHGLHNLHLFIYNPVLLRLQSLVVKVKYTLFFVFDELQSAFPTI